MFAFENRDKRSSKQEQFNRSRRGYYLAQEIATKLREKYPHISLNYVSKILLTLPKEKTGVWTLRQGTHVRRVYLPSSVALVEAEFLAHPPQSELRRRKEEKFRARESEMRKLEARLRAEGKLV